MFAVQFKKHKIISFWKIADKILCHQTCI